jgi:XTP/dITP diphosphohydrolase
MKVVLASGNKGKLAEFRQLFLNSNIELVTQDSLGIESPEETGLSFIENALLKARYASKVSGLPALADDSGLSVDALRGAPGIYSARFAGAGATDQDNVKKLLFELSSVEAASRQARFHCVLAFVRYADDPVPVIAQGHWEGMVLSEPSGTEGFGYDPVFYVESQQCSAAQMAKATKNKISHRGKAIAALMPQLEALGLVQRNS